MEDVLLSSVKERNVSLSNLVNGHLDNELLEGQLNNLPTILGLYNAECTATCERSFSTMRRLETWLRVNTVANLLNDIMFTNIQKAQMDDLNIKAVAQEFANKNEERINFFGCFTE